jgi:hypothetical protein
MRVNVKMVKKNNVGNQKEKENLVVWIGMSTLYYIFLVFEVQVHLLNACNKHWVIFKITLRN